jgi:hypothetical protein
LADVINEDSKQFRAVQGHGVLKSTLLLDKNSDPIMQMKNAVNILDLSVYAISSQEAHLNITVPSIDNHIENNKGSFIDYAITVRQFDNFLKNIMDTITQFKVVDPGYNTKICTEQFNEVTSTFTVSEDTVIDSVGHQTQLVDQHLSESDINHLIGVNNLYGVDLSEVPNTSFTEAEYLAGLRVWDLCIKTSKLYKNAPVDRRMPLFGPNANYGELLRNVLDIILELFKREQ